jgi:hypothetical protein
MRSPVVASSSRPSPSAITRAIPMNARKNGMPMTRIANPAESVIPVITKVKYTMPVASVSSI